jgi:hypothetical protein
LDRLVKSLERLFSKPEPERKNRTPCQAIPISVEAAKSGRGTSTDERLKALLSHKSLVAAGKLQIIGLEMARDHFGNRWESVAERVYVAVENIIKKRLTSTDVFMRYGDQANPAYIILFSELSKEQAQFKSALIAEEIMREVLGEELSSETVAVKTVVTAVDGSLVAEEVDPFEAIMQLLEKEADTLEAVAPAASEAKSAMPGNAGAAAKRTPRVTPGGHINADAAPQGMVSGQRGRLVEMNEAERRATDGMTGDAGPAAQGAPRGTPGGHINADAAPQGMVSGQRGRLVEMNEAEPSGSEATDGMTRDAPADSAEKLSFVYQPVWDIGRGAVLSYRCLPARKTPRQGRLTGYDVLTLDPSVDDPITELDMLVLRQIIQDFGSAHDKGTRLLPVCYVHFDTLSRYESRADYVKICQTMPEQMKCDMVFEVNGVPASPDQMLLSQAVSSIQSYSRAVHGQVYMGTDRFDHFRNVGFYALGLAVDKSSCHEIDLIKIMNSFVVGAGGAGFRTFIRGVGSKSLASAAFTAGFDYIDGDAVCPAVATPELAFRFQPADLFAHLLKIAD